MLRKMWGLPKLRAGAAFALATLFCEALPWTFLPVSADMLGNAFFLFLLSLVPAPLAALTAVAMWPDRLLAWRAAVLRGVGVLFAATAAYGLFCALLFVRDAAAWNFYSVFFYAFNLTFESLGVPLLATFGLTGFLLSESPETKNPPSSHTLAPDERAFPSHGAN